MVYFPYINQVRCFHQFGQMGIEAKQIDILLFFQNIQGTEGIIQQTLQVLFPFLKLLEPEKAFEHQVWIRKLFKAEGSGKEIPCIQLTMPSYKEIGIKHILRLDTKGIFFLLLIQQAGRIDDGFQQPELIHQVLLTSSLPNRGDTMLLNRG